MKYKNTLIRKTACIILVGALTLLALGACNLEKRSVSVGAEDYPYAQLSSVSQQIILTSYVLADIHSQFRHRYWGWERRDYRKTAPLFKNFYREVPEQFYREVERVFARAARIQPRLLDSAHVNYHWHQVVRLAEVAEVAPHMIVDYRFTTEVGEGNQLRRIELMRAVVDYDRWKILYWEAWPGLHPATKYSRAAMAAVQGCARPSHQPYRNVLPPGVDFDELAQSGSTKRIYYAITCREPFQIYIYDNLGNVYIRRSAQSLDSFELAKVAEFDPSVTR